jgi:50S ribosomal protein L16 3-hydroxylase
MNTGESPADTSAQDDAVTAAAVTSLGSESVASIHLLVELGAKRHPHTTHTLFDHLVRTAATLKRWGGRDALWKAGLFHSCYGTEFFTSALLPWSDRARVAEVAGADAENVAHLFCGIDRPSIFRALERGAPYVVVTTAESKGEIAVSAQELEDLVWLLWANTLEHVPQTPLSEEQKGWSRECLAKTAHRLPAIARDELAALYAATTGSSDEPRSSRRSPSVAQLLGPSLERIFREDHWPEKKFVARGPVERLAGLADFEFGDLLRMKRGGTRAFFRTLNGTHVKMGVSAGQETALYSAGFTIYFHALRDPELDEWIAAIERELGLLPGGTRVSAFASRKGPGLNCHYDLNENFVCQARGTKRWRVAPNTHCRKPTVGYGLGSPISAAHLVEAPEGFPAAMPETHETIELTPGTVMFMPRGMWHDTETVSDASLHFNIQCGFATWRDVLAFVLQDNPALHAEEFRDAIRGELDDVPPETLASELKPRLHRLVDIIVERGIEIDVPAFERFVAQRLGRP